MTLTTRRPTCAVPWPLILLEGAEKSGKSWSAASFSASERTGQMYWIDLGEGAADEYGAVPGADYLIVEHDGSYASLLRAITDVREEAQRAADAGEPPVVLVVDSMTAEWDLLKDWAADRAKGSDANKRKLRADPNAEVSVPMNLWNSATARHRAVMTLLLTFPGIVIVTARGKETASLDESGRPVEGSKTYKVEGHKTLAYDATVWVRLSREAPPMVVGARSVHAGVRPGVDEPRRAPNFTVEWLVFDVLQCDPATAHVRDLTEARPHDDDPDPGSGPTAVPAASPEEQDATAAKVAGKLLDADTAARAKWWADKVVERGDEPLDATPHVPEFDRDVLGITDGPVTLGALAQRVTGYWSRHGHGPRQDPARDESATSDAA